MRFCRVGSLVFALCAAAIGCGNSSHSPDDGPQGDGGVTYGGGSGHAGSASAAGSGGMKATAGHGGAAGMTVGGAGGRAHAGAGGAGGKSSAAGGGGAGASAGGDSGGGGDDDEGAGGGSGAAASGGSGAAASGGGGVGGVGGSEESGGAGGAPCPDADHDGVCDADDRCPSRPDTDADQNGYPDACDTVLCSLATDKTVNDPHAGGLYLGAKLEAEMQQGPGLYAPISGTAMTCTKIASGTCDVAAADNSTLGQALKNGVDAILLQSSLYDGAHSFSDSTSYLQKTCSFSGKTIRRYLSTLTLMLTSEATPRYRYAATVEIRGY